MVTVSGISMQGRKVGPDGAIGSGGDQYVGLDRFGRVVDQNWGSFTSGTVTGWQLYSNGQWQPITPGG